MSILTDHDTKNVQLILPVAKGTCSAGISSKNK